MTEREEQLQRSIRELEGQVRILRDRIVRLEGLYEGRAVEAKPAPHPRVEVPVDGEGKGSPLSIGGLAAIMSRGATVSLVLLLALVLRTLTDGGILDLRIGTLLGIGYATLLEAVGLGMYRKGHAYAPIFSVSGILLLVAVVLEAHAGFGSISTVPAYAILALAGSGMALISWRQRVTIPVAVGTVAVLLASMPLAFPKPEFLSLMVYLFVVNIMAFSAAWLPRGWYLRIAAYAYTSSIFFLWSFDLRSRALKSEIVPQALLWFLMVAGLFLAFYIGISVYAIWRADPEHRRPFDNILPTAAAVGAYLASYMVVSALDRGVRALGIAGIIIATALLCIAALKAGRSGTQTRGANTFAFPAAFLLALSFRDLSGESVIALAILAWAALSLGWLSTRWESAGVRVTGYFLQGTVLGASSLLLLASPSGDNTVATLFSMILVAVVALAHFRLMRKRAPSGESLYFTRVDRRDVSRVIPLLVSVGTAFLAVRAGLFTVLGEGPAFTAGQSLALNLGALGLFLIARKRADVEIKWIAVLVTVLGGGKAFLYDLLKIKGLPVVLSVLSFGLAAAAGSWVLGQWHALTQRTDT